MLGFSALSRRWLFALSLGMSVLWLFGCSANRPGRVGNAAVSSNGLRVVGAADVLPLARGVQAVFTQTSQLVPDIQFSETSLADLDDGRADIVLLGREPTEEELRKYDAHVIAYDAVCLLTSTRVYSGGIQGDPDWTPQRFFAKFDGLRNLPVADVEAIVKQSFKQHSSNWFWDGPYYLFERQKNLALVVGERADGPAAIQWIPDPNNPLMPLGTWNKQPTVLPLYTLSPRKIDGAAVLLKHFGYTAADFDNARQRGLLDHSGIVRYFDLEEEAISYYFTRRRTQPAEIGPEQFIFRLMPASRQVTLRAIKARYQVRAVSIDGINPITDIQAIYDGRYLLSRKIYALTRQSPSEVVEGYVRFLLSSEGQMAVEQASFLPLLKS